MRKAEMTRKTAETTVECQLNLDGTGENSIAKAARGVVSGTRVTV